MCINMNEENNAIILDQEKANPRQVAGCVVQTIPARMTKRSVVMKMLAEAYLFLSIKNGELVIEIRRPKKGEVLES